MRKLSKTRSLNVKQNTFDTYPADTRQRRITGATITAGPGSRDSDIDAFFARPALGTTVTGAAPNKAARPAEGTVSLSDGTCITFATVGQVDTVGSV